jgi:hypothetical protein
MNYTQEFLTKLYLEYVNDFITLTYMSEHYNISFNCLKTMVDEGKRIHENHIK